MWEKRINANISWIETAILTNANEEKKGRRITSLC